MFQKCFKTGEIYKLNSASAKSWRQKELKVELAKQIYNKKRKNSEKYFLFCTSSEIRTLDPLIKSQLLYQLS